jgi:hypothetical protein
MAAGDPLLLEGVLLRHKRLRLFVMHADGRASMG